MKHRTFKWKYLTEGEWFLAIVLGIPTFGICFFIFGATAIYHQFLLKDEIKITNNKIIHTRRFITEDTFENSFKNVVEYDIEVKNNIWEALCGAINISLITYIRRGIDSTRKEVNTYRVSKKDAQAFKEEIDKLMERKIIVVGSQL